MLDNTNSPARDLQRSGGTETGVDQADLEYDDLIASFARNNQRALAKRVVEQRRRLAPAVNDASLFTKAAPFGDSDDPFYHAPSNRIGSNYSPSSCVAAACLFEEFPQDPMAPRRTGRQTMKLVRGAIESGIDPILALKAGSLQVRGSWLCWPLDVLVTVLH